MVALLNILIDFYKLLLFFVYSTYKVVNLTDCDLVIEKLLGFLHLYFTPMLLCNSDVG